MARMGPYPFETGPFGITVSLVAPMPVAPVSLLPVADRTRTGRCQLDRFLWIVSCRGVLFFGLGLWGLGGRTIAIRNNVAQTLPLPGTTIAGCNKAGRKTGLQSPAEDHLNCNQASLNLPPLICPSDTRTRSIHTQTRSFQNARPHHLLLDKNRIMWYAI